MVNVGEVSHTPTEVHISVTVDRAEGGRYTLARSTRSSFGDPHKTATRMLEELAEELTESFSDDKPVLPLRMSK